MVGMKGPTVLFLSATLWRTSTGHNREGFYLTVLWIVKIIYSVNGRWMKYVQICVRSTGGIILSGRIKLLGWKPVPVLTTNSLRSNSGPPRRQGLWLTSSASENAYTFTRAKERGPAAVSSPHLSRALQLPLLRTSVFLYSRTAILFTRMLVQVTTWWLSHDTVQCCQKGL